MASRRTDATSRKTEASTPARTIVLADNDTLILEAIGELLRNKDYEVHPARDGLEALRAIRSVKPDVVILDIIMPKLDGSRICAMIRHDPTLRHTPIIALSSLSPEQLRRFPALSADAYVAKGALGVMANNVLMAIKHVDERGRGDLSGGILGYEGFRARRLVSETLAARQHWETLARMLPQGVLELDEDGVILMANAEAARLLGKQESRLIAEPFASFFPPPDREAIEQACAELRGERPAEACRLRLTLRGREVQASLAATVEEGRCSGLLATLQAVAAPGAEAE